MNEPTIKRLTPTLAQVIIIFLDNPNENLSGYDIMKKGTFKSGGIYPLLRRMVDAGWLEMYWEDINPEIEGRPQRRFFKLTAGGTSKAEKMRQRLYAKIEEGNERKAAQATS